MRSEGKGLNPIGSVSLKEEEETLGFAHSLLCTKERPHEDTGRKQPSATHGRELTRNQTFWTLDLRLLVSRTVRKQIFVVSGAQFVHITTLFTCCIGNIL